MTIVFKIIAMDGNVIIPIIISVFFVLNTLIIIGALKLSQMKETGKKY